MKLHGNARTCPRSRLLMVQRVESEGWTLAAAAEAAGVSVRTVSKWLACYRGGGEEGLLDRSSALRSIPHRTPEERVQAIAALRRLRMTAAEIAETEETIRQRGGRYVDLETRTRRQHRHRKGPICRRFCGRSICDRVPTFATTGLHKGGRE
jgi:transposase